MPTYETLLWDHEGQVVTITFNRPEKLNAMSSLMFDEIRDAFDRAADDTDVRCIVVAGAGKGFCSGADLTDPANLVSDAFAMQDRMRRVHATARAIACCPKPTIARVHGVAAGAGCNIALCCDLVVAGREASFAELFVKRGLVVDFGGTWALTRALPLHRAKELALLGDTIDAHEAERLGLVNRLCDTSELDTVVKDLAQRLAALPPRTVALIKENLNRAYERSFEQNLDAESIGQSLMLASEDTREAVVAWVEKREPRFQGR